MAISYLVTKEYEQGGEQNYRRFASRKSAIKFAHDAVSYEASLHVHVIYRVYESGELVDELNSDDVELPNLKSDANREKGKVFNPTPFEKSPRPKGTPPRWIYDDDEPDDDK